MPLSTRVPHLTTLGRLALTDGDGLELVSADSPKQLALLAYLASAPGRQASREHLIDLFWADAPIDKARSALRQSLHKLRSVLGGETIPSGGASDVTVGPALTTDRDAFLDALDTGDLECAVSLYTGPFVLGVVSAGSATFEQWADSERRRLQDLFAAAAESVARHALQRGEPRHAMQLAAQILAADPGNEEAWRLRFEAELAGASRVHLLASIAEFRRQLSEEQRDPEPRTRELLERIEHSQTTADTPASGRDLTAELVGRQAAFAQLYDGWREALARRGCHLHLEGGTGLGKTRLLNDFATRLRMERARVVSARTTPRQRSVPNSMLAALVSAVTKFSGSSGVNPRSAQILVDLQPGISSHFPAAVPLQIRDAEERQSSRSEALYDLLDAVTEDGPVAILLDDTHWWDHSSHEIIADLIERLGQRPVLIVTTSRTGATAISTAITRARIPVLPLDHQAIVALVLSLGECDDSTQLEQLGELLLKASHGIPLLILAALRLGLDGDFLQLDEGKWGLQRLEQFAATLEPRQLLRNRIESLTGPQRDLLLLAAVLEEPISESDANAVNIAEPKSLFAEHERLGLLVARGNGWVVVHDMISETICDLTTQAENAAAHGLAGRLLLARDGSDGPTLQDCWQHFAAANDHDSLVDTAARWVRYRRDEGDQSSTRALLREVAEPAPAAELVTRVLKALPAPLRRRPLAVYGAGTLWTVFGALVVGAGWYYSDSPTAPDAELGLMESGSATRSELVVQIHSNLWDRQLGDLQAVSGTGKLPQFTGNRSNLQGWPVVSPEGRRWLVTRRVSGNLGATELYLIDSSGAEHELAPAHGDDVFPDWSPDGRSAVFSTTRWGKPGDANFDLAIIEFSSGKIRRLTSGPSEERDPHWSPDGTRIAFIRTPEVLAPDQLCWISVDGSREQCHPQADAPGNLSGWIDAKTVVGRFGVAGGESIRFVDIDDGRVVQDIAMGSVSDERLSPKGDWFACRCITLSSQDTAATLMVFRTSDPTHPRKVASAQTPHIPLRYWHAEERRAWTIAIHILGGHDHAAVNSSHRFTVQGEGSDGSHLDLPTGVMLWQSSDTAVATVDAQTGDVRTHKAGSTWIGVSAGGWRRDSIQLLVSAAETTALLSEQWDSTWSTRWASYGTPKPYVERHAAFHHVLVPNGDGEYVSGVYTQVRDLAPTGYGIEAIVVTPITRTKWQFLDFAISDLTSISDNGVGGKQGCGIRVPASPGWYGSHRMAVGVGKQVIVPDELLHGTPYRLRIQLFPDGSCGVAINGVPVDRSQPITALDHPLGVLIGVQSVATKILVGPLITWRGVKGDIDWSVPPVARSTRGRMR